MNERDLFAAANAISDPSARAAFLDRECAGRPELRRDVERLINASIDSDELLDFLAAASVATLSVPPNPPESVPAPPLEPSPSVGAKGRKQRDENANDLDRGDDRCRRRERVFAGSKSHRIAATVAGAAVLALVAVWMAFRSDEPESKREHLDVETSRSTSLSPNHAENRERPQVGATPGRTARFDAENRKTLERRDQELNALRATESDVATLIERRRDLSADERNSLESLVRCWRVFSEPQGNDAAGRLQAEAHLRIAGLCRILGRRSDAIVSLTAACELLQRLIEADPLATADRTQIADARVSLASLLAEVGRKKEALAQYRMAVEHQRLLSNELPTDPTDAIALVATLDELGNLSADLDEREQSLEAFREGLDVQETLADRFPDDHGFQVNLARMRGRLGLLLHRFGKSDEALEQCLIALDLNKKLVDQDRSDTDHWDRLAAAHCNLATILDDSGRMEEALENSRTALSIRLDLVGRRPSQIEHRLMLGDARTSLGDLLARLKRRPEALKEQIEALEVFRKLAAEFPATAAYQERLSRAQLNVGRLLVDSGRPAEALERYRTARDIRRALVERFPGRVDLVRELGRVHRDLLRLLRGLGRTDEAKSEYRSALALQEKLVERFPDDAEDCIDLAVTHCEYGTLLLAEGKAAESLLEFDRAVAMLEPLAARVPPAPLSVERLKDGLWGRANAYAALQRPSRALRNAERVVQLAPENERKSIRASCVHLRLKAGDVDSAVADADELIRETTWNAVEWYNFACVYAAASGKLPNRRDHLAARAVELLQRAAQAGYTDVAHIERDRDLDPIRQREDFKSWLANRRVADSDSP